MTRSPKGDTIFSAHEWRRIKQLAATIAVLGPTLGAGTTKAIDYLTPKSQSITAQQAEDIQRSLDKIDARVARIEDILMRGHQ